ncbi:MAG TPA: hypothetical protein VMM12_18610 [Longimicrobiales bacterium]|nr:hypothetical protein [Longimicrobiales bacterium]
MRTIRIVLPLVALALLSACATTGHTVRRSSPDELTRADLEASMQVNAYEAVRQARPRWLRTRGPNSFIAENPIVVYLDGVRAGGIQMLESIPVLSIERMQFFDATDAQARFGLNHTNGAIEVITRKGP